MSQTYNGNAGAGADPLSLTIPEDGDEPNADSINVALRAITDHAAMLQPAVESAALTRKLIRTISDNKTGKRTRVYITQGGGVEIARNCFWTEATGLWAADDLTIALRANVALVVVDAPSATPGIYVPGYLTVMRPSITAGTTWSDAQWEYASICGESLYFHSAAVDSGSSNPPATDALFNKLVAKGLNKAWGAVSLAAGVASLLEGLNVASVARDGNHLDVTFVSAMADANYEVQVTMAGAMAPPGVLPHVLRSSRTAAGFAVLFEPLSAPGALWVDASALSAMTFGFDFSVRGIQHL